MATASTLLSYIKTLAPGASDTATILVPSYAEEISTQLSAYYAAVAGTTGITFTFTYSTDGITYSPVPFNLTTVNPGANVVLSPTPEQAHYIRGAKKKYTGGAINFIKVAITNLDAVNSASVCIVSYVHTAME